ncbi:hypothetical protein DsansV1_C08g0084121 [Dioscorea sansibarensis]
MSLDTKNTEQRFRGLIDIQAHWDHIMEVRTRRGASKGVRRITEAKKRPQLQQVNSNKKSHHHSSYFSVESFVLLLCLTASLLILPLVLPPLPPPPFMLLLIPIGILLVLVILAFMPSDVRNIASSYL